MSRPIPIPADNKQNTNKGSISKSGGGFPKSLYYHIETVLENNNSVTRGRYGTGDIFYLGFCPGDKTYLTCLRNDTDPSVIYVLCFLCDERSNYKPQCFSFDFYSVAADTSNGTWLDGFTKKTHFLPLLNEDKSPRMWSLGMSLKMPHVLSKSS